MNAIKQIAVTLSFLTAISAYGELVAHFPMEVTSGMITETVSGNTFAVEGHFAPENVQGAVGKALRFDGYTSHVDASFGNVISSGSKQMTVSIWVAMPCYPIIQLDTDTSEKTPIATCLDKESKTGFGFYVGFNGKYSFNTYVGGWPINIEVDTPLPTYQWNNLVAVIDCGARIAKLYNNGIEVGSSKVNGSLGFGGGSFYIGQGTESRMAGPFELMSFNGLIDDISIWNEAKTQAEIELWTAENIPDLNIPSSRFAHDSLRPRFHGMPASGWTNECHGMYWSDDRYHLFFQKNGDGPYMARLHWGHISSTNLYDWQEEKIALAPGNSYDMKGCWSGCIFSDAAITGDKPNILYTSVDYSKASISQAYPETADLINWRKKDNNPIIKGRPAGLSDDFRDPYFFRNGEDAYIIVGTSKNGIGATTLHKYNPTDGSWSNTGQLFFSGGNAATDGSFWEMPNITQMPDGKWLFTATPLGTSQGVRTLYWTGEIASDGTFVPDANSTQPRQVELNSRDGFGLLSPTICRKGDRTIALGIVPDKLPSEINWDLGWAHCYSLPREWSLDVNGVLTQKPAEELLGLRTNTSWSDSNFELNGHLDLSPVCGNSVEICGIFQTGNTEFGFNLFKSATSQAKVYYNPASGEIIADFSGLRRISNDDGIYNGIYRCPLPVRPKTGETMKINIFIDHSILDIFINDKFATSIRVFPIDNGARSIEAYSTTPIKVPDLKAWVLDPKASCSGLNDVKSDDALSRKVSVYNMQGVNIRTTVDRETATNGLPKGIYIIENKKVIVL